MSLKMTALGAGNSARGRGLLPVTGLLVGFVFWRLWILEVCHV